MYKSRSDEDVVSIALWPQRKGGEEELAVMKRAAGFFGVALTLISVELIERQTPSLIIVMPLLLEWQVTVFQMRLR